MGNWTDGSSLASRVAKQFEQQFGRPADANDPAFVEFSRATMPQLMEADRLALERSKRRWQIADRVAMAAAGATLGYGALSGLGVFGGAASSPEFALSTTPFAGTGAVGLPAAAAAGTGAAGAAGAGALAPIVGGAPWAVTPYAAAVSNVPAVTEAGGGVTTLGNLAKILNSPGFSTVAGLGTNLLSNYMANRAQSGASADALAFQREALDRTEALQKEMNTQQQANWEKTMALAQQQYEAEQARRAPYRAASGAALQWLQNNYSQPTSAPYAYNPTITYKG